MQVLLRRRLGMVINPDDCDCEAASCRQTLDAYGNHHNSCMCTGRVHGRHAAACTPWKQVFSESGYRVSTERLLRNTNLAVADRDQRRMDLIAAPGSRSSGAYRGLPLFCDVTVVSPLTARGAPRPGAANHDGKCLEAAIRKKRNTYRDVVQSGNARFIVLGSEVFGRWCPEAATLVRDLANLKAREAPLMLRGAARLAWSRRWWGLITVGTQRAVAEALLARAGPDLVPSSPAQHTPTLADLVSDHV